MNHWYVAQTQPNAEAKALAHLKRQGFRAYLPCYRKSRRHARKVEIVKAPLFPGYLFIKLDVTQEQWRPIRSTIGVTRLICNGDSPVPVPPGIVEDIVARETEDGLLDITDPSPWMPGDTVQVIDGPMTGQVGWFQKLADKDRIMVLLELLGRKVAMPVKRAAVVSYQ